MDAGYGWISEKLQRNVHNRDVCTLNRENLLGHPNKHILVIWMQDNHSCQMWTCAPEMIPLHPLLSFSLGQICQLACVPSAREASVCGFTLTSTAATAPVFVP